MAEADTETDGNGDTSQPAAVPAGDELSRGGKALALLFIPAVGAWEALKAFFSKVPPLAFGLAIRGGAGIADLAAWAVRSVVDQAARVARATTRFLARMSKRIRDAVDAAVTTFSRIGRTLLTVAGRALRAVWRFVQPVWDVVVRRVALPVRNGVRWLLAAAKAAWSRARVALGAAARAIQPVLRGLASTLRGLLRRLAVPVRAALKSLLAALRHLLRRLGALLRAAARATVEMLRALRALAVSLLARIRPMIRALARPAVAATRLVLAKVAVLVREVGLALKTAAVASMRLVSAVRELVVRLLSPVRRVVLRLARTGWRGLGHVSARLSALAALAAGGGRRLLGVLARVARLVRNLLAPIASTLGATARRARAASLSLGRQLRRPIVAARRRLVDTGAAARVQVARISASARNAVQVARARRRRRP